MTIPAFIANVIGAHVSRYPSKATCSRQPKAAQEELRGGVFRPATRRAGLEPLRWHDLRHTATALAISVGAHPKVIQQRLGHVLNKRTLDVHGHLLPNLDVALADAFDEFARETAAAYVLSPLAAVLAGATRG